MMQSRIRIKTESGTPASLFTDNDFDGNFTPKEYEDYNGNGQYDQGLSQVFRNELIITFPNGYLLVISLKRIRMGIAYRPTRFSPKFAVTGGNYQKSWPWGDQAFQVQMELEVLTMRL